MEKEGGITEGMPSKTKQSYSPTGKRWKQKGTGESLGEKVPQFWCSD